MTTPDGLEVKMYIPQGQDLATIKTLVDSSINGQVRLHARAVEASKKVDDTLVELRRTAKNQDTLIEHQQTAIRQYAATSELQKVAMINAGMLGGFTCFGKLPLVCNYVDQFSRLNLEIESQT